MHKVTCHEAARKFGDLIDRARDEPVAITRYGRTAAVLLSGAEYRFHMELMRQAARREMFEAVAAAETASPEADAKTARSLYKLLRSLRRP